MYVVRDAWISSLLGSKNLFLPRDELYNEQTMAHYTFISKLSRKLPHKCNIQMSLFPQFARVFINEVWMQYFVWRIWEGSLGVVGVK